MSIKGNIRKILFVAFWCVFSAGILVLLIAAMRVKKQELCSGYAIEIKGEEGKHFFIDQKDIADVITSRGSFPVKGKPIKSFDLKKMEESLKKNVWISEAELYFDNANQLQVVIRERQPVARVFTSLGNSFYIDSACTRLPLSDKFAAELPVFTNFPSNADKLSAKDRELLYQVKTLSAIIQKDPFWMSLIAQVDINNNREFELIPSIGNQVVEFGDASDADKKFRRLMIFYKQVIAKAGFGLYERIKVQYAGQVVGVKHADPMSKADSLQAIRNIQKLIEQAQTEQERMLKMDSLNTIRHRTDSDDSNARFFENNTATPSMIPGQSDSVQSGEGKRAGVRVGADEGKRNRNRN